MSIPGLDLVSSETVGTVERSIDFESFTGTFKVPEMHLTGGCRQHMNFTKLCNLKEGSCWRTYKCQDQKDGKTVLLKKYGQLRDSENGLTTMLHEIDILCELKHTNIIKLIETVAGKQIDSLCLALEYCRYGLAELIEENCDIIFEPSVVKYIMKNICDGLEYIHARKVIHRNINCQTVFLNEAGVLKIANFEDSCLASWKKKPLHFQTPLCYQAPEVLYGSEDYGFPVDMWSVGCILAELIQKTPIFYGETNIDVLKKIMLLLGAPDDDVWPGCSQLPHAEEFKTTAYRYTIVKKVFWDLSCPDEFSLIKNLLLYYPWARLTAEQCQKHVYFNTKPFAPSPEELAEELMIWSSEKECDE